MIVVDDNETKKDEASYFSFWSEEIDRYCNKKTPLIFATSKSDLLESLAEEKKEKFEGRIQKWKELAKEKGFEHYCVSGKTGGNIHQLFKEAARLFLKNRGIKQIETAWRACKESDEEWGTKFRRIVVCMLALQRRKNEGLVSKIPKPVVLYLLTKMSEICMEKEEFEWLD